MLDFRRQTKSNKGVAWIFNPMDAKQFLFQNRSGASVITKSHNKAPVCSRQRDI